MQITIKSSTGNTFNIETGRAGENQQACPECKHTRRHPNAKSFSYNTQTGKGFCHNCNVSFFADVPNFFVKYEKKEYKRPEPPKAINCTEKAIKYFESRKISRTTIDKMKIYSTIEWMPQFQKETEVFCFPYYRNNELVNIKFRGAQKSFKLAKDAELIWYNFDALAKYKEIIIVEGEFDALSWIGAGFENVISVPNGAGTRSLEFIESSFEILEKIEKFYIATDNDSAGVQLRNELVIRLGHEKCNIVTFGECKDSNEFMQKYSGFDLGSLLQKSYPVPVDGIVDLEKEKDNILNLFINGLQPGKTIGIPELDKQITYELGRLMVVTGITSHGKSEYVDFLYTQLNLLYDWKTAYFSPENYPIQYHYAKIFSKVSGMEFSQKSASIEDFNKYFEVIKNRFHFIYPENDSKIETILEKAKVLIKRNGVKCLIIDPFNKLEHVKNRGESETEYISRVLDMIIMFAKKYNILVCIVAHPTKLKKANNVYEVPNLYDINGSANWYNKSDYGIVIYRNFESNITEVHNIKIKFRHLGEGGIVELKYNLKNGRFAAVSNDFENLSLLAPEAKPDFWAGIAPNTDFDEPLPF